MRSNFRGNQDGIFVPSRKNEQGSYKGGRWVHVTFVLHRCEYILIIGIPSGWFESPSSSPSPDNPPPPDIHSVSESVRGGGMPASWCRRGPPRPAGSPAHSRPRASQSSGLGLTGGEARKKYQRVQGTGSRAWGFMEPNREAAKLLP